LLAIVLIAATVALAFERPLSYFKLYLRIVGTAKLMEEMVHGGNRSRTKAIPMEFEFDEDKRLENIERHGIDFIDADILFGNPHLEAPAKTVDGEQRWLAVGTIDDVFVTAVFTRRGPVIRVISMRRARDEERERYQQVFGE
jgi:uncharacterized protein